MLNPLTIALLATLAGVANAKCNRDNCLRAIIASACPTRSGSADCASYFRTTVTPATVTYTATLSQTESTTTSGTALEVTTTTEILPVTVVDPTTITVVETDFATVVINAKRQQLEDPFRKKPESPFHKQIPAYASACSGAVRYSSACSCVGATQSTVIAAAPSTTITVTVIGTETFTYLTTTTSTAVETDFSTITNTQIITIPTTTIATTTTIHTRPPYQKCLGPFNALGNGCSANCYCDQLAGAREGFCNAATLCGISCLTDLDCPDYSACTSGHPECNGGNVCVDFSLCLALNVPKRLAMRESAENKRNGILIRPTD